MKAIVYRAAGGPDVIAVEERPDPVPGSNQVLVRVKAAGLNRADLIQRCGGYPAPPGWPADIPGLEYAGTIKQIGPGVTEWQVGDRVMGLVGGGSQAELLVTHRRELLSVPAELDDEQAAAIPEAFLTAYDGLVVRGRVAGGERVLIHAVGSGVSTAAVQLARWLGAIPVGTSRTAAKLEQARTLGMMEGIDTSLSGFQPRLSGPVNVILDYFGGPALGENLASLAPKGRLVLLGTLQGAEATNVNLGLILRSRLEIIGTVMRSRPHEERVLLVEQFRAKVLPEFSAGGSFRPIVGEVFAMEQIALAHQAMEANRVFGKIVLRW